VLIGQHDDHCRHSSSPLLVVSGNLEAGSTRLKTDRSDWISKTAAPVKVFACPPNQNFKISKFFSLLPLAISPESVYMWTVTARLLDRLPDLNVLGGLQ
jgi:hypothetical protein